MGSIEARIEASINGMAHKLFMHARKPYDAVQLMYLFLDPQYHGPMQIAFIQNQPSLTQSLYIDIAQFAPAGVEAKGYIEFTWRYLETPNGFFPRANAGGSMQHPVVGFAQGSLQQPGLVANFIETAEQVVRISYEWGLVKRVFRELNQPGYCTTPPQMRYVWPSILPILKSVGNKDDDRLAASMAKESSRAGDKARIPLVVQPVLRESYQIVTRSIVVLDHPVEDRLKDIRYNITQAKFKVHGLEFDGAQALL